MFKKLVTVLLLTLPFVYSCKKGGCIDPTAMNYSSTATKDDGSCITAQDIKNTKNQNVYVENFNLTFTQSSSFSSYIPFFNYEDGDMIIIETINDFDEWTALPYILDENVHVSGSYDQNGTIWVYLKNDDGSFYLPPATATVTFRAGLIKKSGLKQNPNLKHKTISELLVM